MKLLQQVALKVLKDKVASNEALLEEAKAAAVLNHANVCTVYSIDTIGDVPAIVMEFVDGETLDVRMKAGSLGLDAALDFFRQTCAGVAAAHKAGIVHGDLKPANLKIASDGTLRIMDFGMARQTGKDQIDRKMDDLCLMFFGACNHRASTLHVQTIRH